MLNKKVKRSCKSHVICPSLWPTHLETGTALAARGPAICAATALRPAPAGATIGLVAAASKAAGSAAVSAAPSLPLVGAVARPVAHAVAPAPGQGRIEQP